MASSNQEKQDQRSSSSIEDSAMTIEFLRARLLAERSVSKSARQRAEELTKRVEELEEQLRIVSLQRRMAEKATVDVLSILENRGISDTSETFDSSSDRETHQDSQEGNNYPNREDHPVSRRRSKLEEFSGSDLDSSPVSGRSLSWKGRSKSPRSHEKCKDPSMRRRHAFSSIGSSSPRHHLGKSCRQIRRRETRTMVEEHRTEPTKRDSQENGFANGIHAPLEGVPDCSYTRGEMAREGFETQKVVSEGPFAGIENGRTTNHLDINGNGQDRDMEKALEDHAQLIGQYEEMEKAQREWEEKFKENNASTPDSYDPGNHSDVTQERDEVKAQKLHNSGTDISEAEDAKSKEVDVSKSQPNGFLPPSHVDMVEDQTSSSANSVGSRSQAQEFAFPTAKEKEIQNSRDNHDCQPSESLRHDPPLNGPLSNRSSDSTSSDAGSSSHKRDASERRNNFYALVPHNAPNALGGVLDALKQAKLSLQHKINGSLPEGTTTVNKSIEPPAFDTRIGDRSEIPVGCSGLFRLPTDFSAEQTSSRVNFLGLESRLALAPYYPDGGVAATAPDRFITSSYIEGRSGFPDDRFFKSSSVVSESRASTLNLHFDSYLDTGVSLVNRYNYTPHPYPPCPPFPDLMPQIPSDQGLIRPFPSSMPYATPPDR
ncbi:transcriptional regulator ATRX [Parasponia andersonii]|uniref:Transcriptional regulator ATRX n=1 Tax=Parasponia andersonii TaxID=3476 RepID=A0A2P5C5Q6_PARAD|nr:transcriptional regulator ATRX [Parasponia andersonii]